MEKPSPPERRSIAPRAPASSDHGLERRDTVRLVRGLVGADAADPRETHRKARFVARAFVDRIERHFQHQALLDLPHRPEAFDGMATNPAVDPFEFLVGESEIGLADG